MNIAFFSSEVAQFAKTGGMADVCESLPLALEKIGHQVVIFMPYYRGVENQTLPLKVIQPDLISTKVGRNIDVYFIQNKKFFDRSGLYGDAQGDYPDNLLRFQFFSQQSLELLKRLNRPIDIVHCHDWQTALIPVYLKFLYTNDSFYSQTKSLLMIHNLAYLGLFPREQFPHLGLTESSLDPSQFDWYGQISLLKAGIFYSDEVVTVSERYAKEIQDQKISGVLAKIVNAREKTVVGILNGLNYEIWNPETDPWIEKKYSEENLSGKVSNKQILQNLCHLPPNSEIPLISYVGRLAYQKGIDLIAEALDEFTQWNVQLVILGEGEAQYQDLVKEWQKRFPDKIASFIQFNEALAHKVYAGSDLLLMPSRYEPCGLSQMISLRYGTIPIVFYTGGLADTVSPFDTLDSQGNGFVFLEYNKVAFLKIFKQAIDLYGNQKMIFEKLIKKCMGCRFRWEDSAQKYNRIYQHLMD